MDTACIVMIIVALIAVCILGCCMKKHTDNFEAGLPAPILAVVLPPVSCLADSSYPEHVINMLKRQYPMLEVHLTKAAHANDCRVVATLYPLGSHSMPFPVSNSFLPGEGLGGIQSVMAIRPMVMTKPVVVAQYPAPATNSNCPITWQTTYERTIDKAQSLLWKRGIVCVGGFGNHSDCNIHYTFYPNGLTGASYPVPTTVQHAADLMTWVSQF